MKKRRNNTPLILLAVAAVLLIASTVGTTQAALTYYSENYLAEVTVSNIGVTLLENDQEISCRNYLQENEWDTRGGELLANLTSVTLGKTYEERLSVKNSGAIDSYVRVILTRSWQYDRNPEDEKVEYEKDTTLSPELIELNLLTGENGWIVDESASTAERTVLYYTEILPAYDKDHPGAEETPDFSDTLRIDPSVGTKVIKTESADGKTVVYTYEYDGYKFVIEAEVDAVQTHNAVDAIKSAWGVDMELAEDGSGSLSLR